MFLDISYTQDPPSILTRVFGLACGKGTRYLRGLFWRAMRHRCRQGGPVFGRMSVQVGDVGLLLPSVVQKWHRLETFPAALVPNTLCCPTKGTRVACSRRRVSDETVVVLDAQALWPDGYVGGTSVKCLLHLADVYLIVRAKLSLLKGKGSNTGRYGPVVLAFVPYLLHGVVHHLRENESVIKLDSDYFTLSVSLV